MAINKKIVYQMYGLYKGHTKILINLFFNFVHFRIGIILVTTLYIFLRKNELLHLTCEHGLNLTVYIKKAEQC